MMRQLMVVVAIVLIDLTVQSRGVDAQDTPQTSPTQLITRIPLRMLQQISRSREQAAQLRVDVQQSQIDEMTKVIRAHAALDSEVGALMRDLNASPYANQRLNVAAGAIQKAAQAELAEKLQQTLTESQQATIRRRNRRAIREAYIDEQRMDQSMFISTVPIDRLMTNGDYLSIIEQPWIQELVEITDEQLVKIEELRTQAAADALATARESLALHRSQRDAARDETVPKSAPSDARDQLNQRTFKVLTPEQAKMYEQLVVNPKRFEILVSNTKTSEPREMFRASLPHGAIVEFTTTVVDGRSNMTVVLNNVFERPGVIKELGLTERQQKEINQIFTELTPKISADIQGEHNAAQDRSLKRREAHDLLYKAHVERFSAAALAILTDDQRTMLEKNRYRGLGLELLQRPNIVEILKLTPEQIASVAEIRARIAPKPEPAAMMASGSAEEFQKRMQEMQRIGKLNYDRVNEFTLKQNDDLAAVLNDTQRKVFTDLTGHQFRNRGPNANPAISL